MIREDIKEKLAAMPVKEKDLLLVGLLKLLNNCPVPASSEAPEETVRWCNKNYDKWRDDRNLTIEQTKTLGLDVFIALEEIRVLRDFAQHTLEYEDIQPEKQEITVVVKDKDGKIASEKAAWWLVHCANAIVNDEPKLIFKDGEAKALIYAIEYRVQKHEGLITFTEVNGVWGSTSRISFERIEQCWQLSLQDSTGTMMADHIRRAYELICNTFGKDFEEKKGQDCGH